MSRASTAANVTRYREPVAKPRTAKGRARLTVERLAEVYPGTAAELCALDFKDPFQLLAATILSAQSTDVRVNMVTPALFAAYPDAGVARRGQPRARRGARPLHRVLPGQDQEPDRHGQRGGGPLRRRGADRDLEDLVTIPGVGRKTGNVVRSVAFGLPGLPVDTHVLRVSERLHLTEGLPPPARKDAVKVEHELNGFIPPAERGAFSLRVILHGRRHVCCPETPLRRMLRWPISALRYGNRRSEGHSPPFWAIRCTQGEIGNFRRYHCRRNRFPPPGSKRVDAGIRLPADSPNAGLRAGIGVSGAGRTGWRPVVLLQVLPSDHGHEALGVAR